MKPKFKMTKLLRWKLWVLFGLGSLVIVIDQWTKKLIDGPMVLGQSIPVIQGLFSITYVRNKGAAFGILHNAPAYFREPFFVIVPLVALSGILFVFLKLTEKQKGMAVWLSLILAGAIGNLIDRMRFGYVIDFLDFYVGNNHWPAFNVADSCIVVGVSVLLIQSFFQEKSARGL